MKEDTMKKSLYIVIAALFMAIFLFAGCATQDRTESTSDSAEYYADMEVAEAPAADGAYEEEYAKADTDDVAGTNSDTGSDIDIEDTASILEPGVDRKIIYSGYIQAQTKNFDADYDNIINSLKTAGGYVENSYIYGTEPEDWQDSGRSAELTVRIPSSQFDTFMEMLKGLGDNISSSVSGQDISLQYFDAETHLATLRVREERLMELLEQAAGLEDIIELERELADVSYEIQMYETELRNYDSLIDYSTVTITLQEVNEITRVTASDESLGTRIQNGFFSVLNVLADIGEGLLIFLLAGSPILVPMALIAILIIVLVKRHQKKHPKKTTVWQQQGNPYVQNNQNAQNNQNDPNNTQR